MVLTDTEIEDFKNRLKQRKGVISQHVSKVKRLQTENEVKELSAQISKTRDAFNQFDDLFTEFVNECGEDGTYSEQWFDDVQKNYLDAYTCLFLGERRDMRRQERFWLSCSEQIK